MNMNNPLENLRQLTEAVRMAGVDIAPTYIEYVQLAFAIANDCGEAGRNDFLSLCSLSSKYDEKNAQALFSNALHADKEDIHLGTVFHLAGQCGVKISGSAGPHKAGTMGTAGTAPDFPHTCARYNKVENDVSDDTDEEEQLTEGSEPYSPLPTFPQDYVWPELLEKIISFGKKPEQRDVLLLGAFTVLGASLSHIVRCQYGRKWQAPCMQTFVVAPSASGKSALTWVRLLIEPIHDKIRSEVKEAMKTYRREKAAYDSLGKERKNQEAPVLPPNRMFLISGNNTGTGILQNIMDSNGTGIICESEAHRIHRHRDRIRKLERHAAQGVRPRPPVLQPAYRPRISGGEQKLPLRAALGYARTGKAPDPHGGERSVLPPELLLYATRHPVGRPVRRG